MTYTAETQQFRFPSELCKPAVEGKRVFITGAGKDRGIGQGLALAAGLGGAASVAVHFHSSYQDGFDLVDRLQAEGVNAFPVQADVTNLRDLWAMRSYVIKRMGGLPPNLIICNSGLSESGYRLGVAAREVEGESRAMRRARVRRDFISNLTDSNLVLDTKINGFLAATHLWAGEAVYHKEPAQFVYVSSRQATEPGVAVPGYVIANWAVLQLPKVLKVNLGKNADLVSSFCVLFPFIRTGMTSEYADNPKVFGRWQPRMLELNECAESFIQLLSLPAEQTNDGIFQLTVKEEGDGIRAAWQQVELQAQESDLGESSASLRFG